MNPAEGLVALAGIIAVFGTPLLGMHLWVNRPAAKGSAQPRADSQLDARLDRIENAIQAIALETERIAEGQRFTTKLLSANRDRVLTPGD